MASQRHLTPSFTVCSLHVLSSCGLSCHQSAGVLTKLDIMDKGTDASAMMRNQIVPLRLGYIGMVNRSQMDINLNRSIRDAGNAEAAFFESHPEYQEVRFCKAQAHIQQKRWQQTMAISLPNSKIGLTFSTGANLTRFD